MAKIPGTDIVIEQPNGGSHCGFQSVLLIQSCVSVKANGCGVTIAVERDMEDHLKPTDLTLEETWILYQELRSMLYRTRKLEQETLKNKYNAD